MNKIKQTLVAVTHTHTHTHVNLTNKLNGGVRV